ncbi:MAG TPA: hypothetical protein EYP98_04945, partial [Planctomycetes bacterium]|nr:hypothetical protein [Planctomycetota bacterium]
MRKLHPLMKVEYARFYALSRVLESRDVPWLYASLQQLPAAERVERLAAARACCRDPKQLDQLHALQEKECPVEVRGIVALSIVASQLPSCKSATVVRVPVCKAIDAATICDAISQVLPIDRQQCLELHGIVRQRRSSSDVPWSSQMESTRLNPVHLCGPNLD